MQIPIRIILTTLPDPGGTLTWGDVVDQWEAYALEWQEASSLQVAQDEAPILDMYEDEAITIKDVVKDLSDPSKLFTEFSRSFTIPASKKNNKILKHYYNIDIYNGLDTRETISAKILINNVTYKVGNVSVESVKMNNGKPMSYTIRFYGKLSELSRKIGQDKLSDLDWSNDNIYAFNAKSEFDNTVLNNVVFPLATLGDRYIIDNVYTAATQIDKTRNIKYVGSTRAEGNYGISSADVVGALKVSRILEKISSRYGITFSGAFNEPSIYDLYLWLNKQDKQRNDNSLAAGSPVNLFGGNSSAVSVSATGSSIYLLSSDPTISHEVRYRVTYASGFTGYMIVNGSKQHSVSASGVWSSIEFNSYGTKVLTWEVESLVPGSASIEVEVKMIQNGVGTFTETWFGNVLMGTDGNYNISEHVPEMKVSDFLSSLFKMFNIVATVNDALDVNGKFFDHFMSQGNVIDVSKYVDVSNYDVNKSNIYSSIDFKFSDPKTALELGYKKANSKDYGRLVYELTGSNGFKLTGDAYELQLNNQRIPNEPLAQLNGEISDYIYTQFSNLSNDSVQTDPCFTYVVKNTVVNPVAWDNGSLVQSVTNYLMPCNLLVSNSEKPLLESNTYLNGLYFSEELNPYNTSTNTIGTSLWNCFYKGITSLMFDENKRSVKFKAFIPKGILINATLADTFVISNNFYTINSIETNYLTGESLLNLTLTGKSKIRNFEKNTETITNASATDVLRIVYMNQSGSLVSQNIAASGSAVIDKIGDLIWSNA